MFWINVVQTWCVLTILLEIDYMECNTFVNYNEMKTLLQNSKSVFIDGDKIELDNWLPNVFNEEEVNDNKNSKIMYTFIKCECAIVINKLIGSIYGSITHSNNDQQINSNTDALQDKDGKTLISFLEKLNSEIKLAITTLFEIRDAYPNLRFVESYFLKTLLMTSFYIDGLTYAKKKSEDPTIDDEKNQKAAHIKEEVLHMKKAKMDDNVFVDNAYIEKLKSTQHTIELTEMLRNMRRVILQIMNLIDRYTIEYCEYCHSCTVHNDKNMTITDDNGEFVFETQLVSFNNFLSKIVTFDSNSPSYTTINMEDIMLKKCLKSKYNSDSKLFTFCLEFVCNSMIETPNNNYMFIGYLYNMVESSFDIQSIYEYILAVYKIILKLIYKETQELFKSTILMDVDKCKIIISKLKLMNFPVEIIHNFEFILQAKTYKNSSEISNDEIRSLHDSVCKLRLLDHINVRVHSSLQLTKKISLSNLMDIILGIEFKQFWWVFNLLYTEAQKKSHRAYDSTLDLFPENSMSSVENNNTITCDALTKIYENYFYIESMNNRCLQSNYNNYLDNIISCFKEIRDRNTLFTFYLLLDVDKWERNNHLENDNDLRNIFTEAIIHFKNESNYYIDTQKYQNESTKSDLRKLILRKLGKLKRIGDIIMNLLDNYQIRKCEFIKFRSIAYEGYTKNDYDKIQPMHISGPYTRSISTDRDSVSNNRENDSVISYNISELTGEKEIRHMEMFGTAIFFNWQGEIKSMHEIQIDVLENMLDIHDLVEYQRLFLKWIIYLSYYMWFVVFERINSETSGLDESNRLSQIMKALTSVGEIKDLNYPEPYKKYGELFEAKHFFFSKLDLHSKGFTSIQVLKEVLIQPMANLLGVVKENYIGINVIKQIFSSDSDNSEDLIILTNIYPSLLSFMKKILCLIDKEFIFFKQKLQTFNLTLPHY